MAGNFPGQSLTDTAVVFEKAPEDSIAPGHKYRMTYLFFNNSGKGSFGYEAALATSADLLNWEFNKGGDRGVVFKRNPVKGTYDYGGVTFGGMHFQNASLRSRRLLKKVGGRYHALYGCYPSRDGYEAGNGGQGVAYSKDGVQWERVSQTVPVLTGGSSKLKAWESEVVYEPFLVEPQEGVFLDFYNARGINEYGKRAEESGLASLNLSVSPPAGPFPGITATGTRSAWVREDGVSPVLPSGAPGSADTAMASDPKVFWDEEQRVWVCFYFGLGDATHGHADVLVAFARDLEGPWYKDPEPLYKAGGHPMGIDQQHAHKISIIFDDEGTGYLFYTAVGPKGRGIALLTSQPKK